MRARKKQHKMTPESAKLTNRGYLRFSRDLIPSEWTSKDTNFAYYLAYPKEKRLQIILTPNGNGSDWPSRKVTWSQPAARSPHISIREVLKTMGVPVPKKAVEYKVHKWGDKLTIQF